MWGEGAFPLHITADSAVPVMVSISGTSGALEPLVPGRRARPGVAEILLLGESRRSDNGRAIGTALGDRLRYVRNEQTVTDGVSSLKIFQRDDKTGLEVSTNIIQFDGVDAYRMTTSLTNTGDERLCVLQVASASVIGLTGFLGETAELDLWSAHSEWCAESRWFATPLGGPSGLADINTAAHQRSARGTIARASQSTWPTGQYLPVAAISNRSSGKTLIWQVENNGPWRWEVDTLFDARDALALALLGPTDIDHAWSIWLEPGDSFETIPASFALSLQGVDGAVAALTDHRRRSHVSPADETVRELVFNDYMNALMGDPATDKLLPLIDAAASVGARIFCIDAGWYDDGGDWWPSVGAWEPSTVRFPGAGLRGVLDAIRKKGMKPGLWVEPEVVGVQSPVAQTLPDDAFLVRDGVRIVERQRYFLDLRNEAARTHLDGVFKRLIEEYGATYFKWDYNVTPGLGPNTAGKVPGAGLLEHSRALLDWVEELRSRYPQVIFEACSSGAQRMDAATLAHFDLQSTSDQQDYLKYPVISAAAPMSMSPEMAGNWAYPQSEWSDEQIAFTLVNGLSGRLYLSGNLDKLSEHQLEIVREATLLYPDLIAHHSVAHVGWPLGLPCWDAPSVAVYSETADATYVFVWHRGATSSDLCLPSLKGSDVKVEIVFPTTLPSWECAWEAPDGILHVDSGTLTESARVFRISHV